jgi:hypothetical protein
MKPLRLAIACAAALGLPMAAQNATFGISAGATAPSNDLHAFNGNAGGTLGGFLDLDLGGGGVLRPRVDAAYLPSSTKAEGGILFRRDFWTGCLSADYLYHLSGTRRGLFGIAGAGLYHLETKVRGGSLDRKDKVNKFGGTLGFGYTFDRHWDAELRYAYTTFTSGLASQQATPTLTAGMLVLAASYRF